MTEDVCFRLSKSKIAAFEHCPRRLWLQIHRRDKAHHEAETLARFRFGHDVGARATLLIPDGIMIEAEPDMQAALQRTSELVAHPSPKPLFEATFQYKDVLIRADILEPDGVGGWRAIEVKASARVKDYQIADLATQIWVMRGCGLTVSRAMIRHLAPPFSWAHSDVNSIRLVDSDVTDQVNRRVMTRARLVAKARSVVVDTEPHRPMGSWCTQPLACEFQRHCKLAAAFPLLARL